MNQPQPLAEQMRPLHLKDVVGHRSLLADGQIIAQIIATKTPVSLILWGPPGSGKTTLARIIAREVEADFIEISAVTNGIADVKNVIKHAEQNQRLGMRTVLFVDEIHRFNKAQQDAFLPHVESGLITLIGATTENPSFEIINPLLSRSRVVVLEPLNIDDISAIIKRAAKQLGIQKRLKPASIRLLAEIAQGDARIALGNLELAMQLSSGPITPDLITTAAQKRLPSYDKKGDNHYNIISAFIKSLRGSDATAALYYLARMLQAGEDPKFIARRMIIFASEDVGVAASPALNIAVSTFQAVERIGMPECRYNLFHCATVLALCKKSRAVSDAMYRALAAAEKTPDAAVPIHLRNAPTKLMKDLDYGKGYMWQADFKPDEGFLPPEVTDTNFFS